MTGNEMIKGFKKHEVLCTWKANQNVGCLSIFELDIKIKSFRWVDSSWNGLCCERATFFCSDSVFERLKKILSSYTDFKGVTIE